MRSMVILFIFSILMAGEKSELKNVKVLSYKTKVDIMKYMKTSIVKELGAECNYCHNINDYSSDENEHKLVAREMMQMVININENTMKPLKKHEISCWVCHRGQKQPEYKKK